MMTGMYNQFLHTNDWNLGKNLSFDLPSGKTITDNDKAAIEANTQAEIAAQGNAKNAATAAQNAGVNKSAAAMTGSQTGGATTTDTANAMYGANTAVNSQTKADYLEKMGQLEGLDYQTKNMNKANKLNTIGVFLGGSASDENVKEAPESDTNGSDTNNLMELVNKFFELKAQLDELKAKRNK